MLSTEEGNVIMMKLYWSPRSRSFSALWLMEETGEPYERVLTDISKGAQKTPEYLAINPMGKVPALRHGDVIVTETAAICAYLADVFPQAGLAPPSGDPLRGPYYRWLFFAAGPVEAAASNRMLGFAVPQERERMIGYGNYAAVIDTLDDAISRGDYLVGGRFSAADVYVGSHIGFGMQFGTIEKRPAFERYWSVLSARPAALRAKQIDDDLASAS